MAKKPCPRCQQPLDIPDPPGQVSCQQCGAVIKIKGTAPASESATAITTQPKPTGPQPAPAGAPAPLAAPSRKGVMILLGALGGAIVLGLFGLIGIGLIVWLLSGRTEEKKPVIDDHQEEIAQEDFKDPVGPAPPPPEMEKEPEKSRITPRIQAAIDKGAAYLKKRLPEQRDTFVKDNRYPGDSPVGAAALTGLALLEAKVPPDDPAIQQVLGTVRTEGPKLRMVYAQGATLFFLNRMHEANALKDDDRELIRSLALRLIDGQQTVGCWTYNNPPINAKQQTELLASLNANKYKPHGKPGSYASHSMTQFALLGLWGSRKHGIPARPALLASAAHFHKVQHANGTWGYRAYADKPDPARVDSNTCAGLIALAMEKTLREDRAYPHQANDLPINPNADAQCEKAFAHLGRTIGRTEKDGSPLKTIGASAAGDYYFLWSLERVAVIYDLKTIGGKDWYGWGSEILLQHQRPNGSWNQRWGDVCDTCFAILFLTRANLAKDLTESIRARAAK